MVFSLKTVHYHISSNSPCWRLNCLETDYKYPQNCLCKDGSNKIAVDCHIHSTFIVHSPEIDYTVPLENWKEGLICDCEATKS